MLSVNVYFRSGSIDRDPFFGFTLSIYQTPVQMMINLNQAPVDITLFLRPFTVPSWKVEKIARNMVFQCILCPRN